MLLNSPYKFFLFSICLILLGCGESQSERVERAIMSANQDLSTRSCDSAIKKLEEVGRQHNNAMYLVTLASAYACRAGFSEITFFAEDISKVGNPAPYGGSTRFTTSPDFESKSDMIFDDLNEAIDILLFAGGQSRLENPSFEHIERVFSDRSGDIFAASLYMVLVQKGRFLHLFGQADQNGEKGRCFLNYDSDPFIEAYLSTGNTGTCDNNTMNAPTPLDDEIELICRGLTLSNVFLDLIPVVLNAYAGGELDDIFVISDLINDLKDDIVGVLPPQVEDDVVETLDLLSERKCVEDFSNNQQALHYYYGFMMESLYN